MKSITMENFGPIKRLVLDLDKQYNVLIGGQAVGKSTAVKSVAFFSSIAEYFGEVITKKIHSNIVMKSRDFILLLRDIVLDKFMLSFSSKFLNDDTFICCDYGDGMWLDISLSDKKLLLKISGVLESRLLAIFERKDFSGVSENLGNIYDTVVIGAWLEDLKEIFGGEKVIYIPAGRSTLSAMININAFTKEAVGSPDFAVANYLKQVMICKNSWSDMGKWGFGKIFYNEKNQKRERDQIVKFEKLSKGILKGKYLQKHEEDYILIKGGKGIPITYASSGQQEVLWIINLLKMILAERIAALIIVEEPEAHLYPDAQLDLVKLVAFVVNCTGSKIFVTTHSPYILSAFNLLLHSGYVENNGVVQSKAKTTVIEADFRINPGRLIANKIDDNGKVINLISDERQMVDILAIDGVSSTINDYTDKLISREIRYGL